MPLNLILKAVCVLITLCVGAPKVALAETSGTMFPASRLELSTAPMRLGRPFESQGTDDGARSRRSAKEKCTRWRAIAQHLGESYAGYTLRSGVVRRMCDGPLVDHGSDSWDWPWAGLAQGRLLPPRSHKTFENWQIRCGAGVWRHRCAAISSLATSHRNADGSRRSPMIAHFIIDMVAGRESVLWRLYVPTEAEVEADADTVAAGLPPGASAGAEGGLLRDFAAIRYSIGAKAYEERFVACGRDGCLMEAALAASSEIATRLWDGIAIDLKVAGQGRQVIQSILPSRGFRAALSELMRLRQTVEVGRR